MKKFVVLGQPRSGTTFLVDFINSLSDAACENELFNPHAIFYLNKDVDNSVESILEREKNPVEFLDDFYSNDSNISALGFNLMIGHNIQALDYILSDEDIKIIYLNRENKLAQFASWKKALDSAQWATRSEDEASRAMSHKIKFNFREFNRIQSPFTSLDRNIQVLLESIDKSRLLKTEYSVLFDSDEQDRILSFIGAKRLNLEHEALKKQGLNKIVNRFENTRDVENYIRILGKYPWLDDEISQKKGPDKFVVLAQTRTGSSFLVDLINVQTDAFCDSEIFNPNRILGAAEEKSFHRVSQREAYPTQFIDSFYKDGEDFKVKGFKLLLNQNFEALDYVITNPDIKIIYLSRDNKLAQYASFKVAAQTGVWSTTDEEVALKNKKEELVFNRANFTNTLGEFESFDYIARKRLNQIESSRVLSLKYRDVIQDKDRVVGIISDFLGTKVISNETPRLLKLGSNNHMDRFTNPGLVKSTLTSIGRAKWLDSEF